MDENELRMAIKKAKAKEPTRGIFHYDNSSRFTIYDLVKLTGIKGWKLRGFSSGSSKLNEGEQEKVWLALEVLTRGMG